MVAILAGSRENWLTSQCRWLIIDYVAFFTWTWAEKQVPRTFGPTGSLLILWRWEANQKSNCCKSSLKTFCWVDGVDSLQDFHNLSFPEKSDSFSLGSASWGDQEQPGQPGLMLSKPRAEGQTSCAPLILPGCFSFHLGPCRSRGHISHRD